MLDPAGGALLSVGAGDGEDTMPGHEMNSGEPQKLFPEKADAPNFRCSDEDTLPLKLLYATLNWAKFGNVDRNAGRLPERELF